MHDSMIEVLDNIKVEVDNIFGAYSVLEVGSADINGSLRKWFSNGCTQYLGIDIDHEDNHAVDLVLTQEQMYDWPITDSFFDISVSANTYEHVEFPWQTLKETVRCVRVGGMIVVHSLGEGFQHHSYPIDCWRYQLESFHALGNWVNEYSEYEVEVHKIFYHTLETQDFNDVWGMWRRKK
jgi:hypothetical protein|tara:strand:+ start:1448 stop:1987 length:540 start_codon:yes stop_codon:yes gene_type:complete